MNAQEAKIQTLCRHLEAHADAPPTLEALGAVVGWSPHHLQRTFKAVVGVTPKQYLDAVRFDFLREELRDADSVTDAIFEAGFGSVSRVYERSDARLGMTPSQYRSGGRGVAISWVTAQTPMGVLMLAATDRGLCQVQIGDGESDLVERLEAEFPRATFTKVECAPNSDLGRWLAALRAHLDGAELPTDLPLDIRGTAFQVKVWRFLHQIPKGEVRTYSEVAREMGRPTATRAVARACATNRVALVIPCHRVIRSDGGLGGYRWGIERKRALLAKEKDVSG